MNQSQARIIIYHPDALDRATLVDLTVVARENQGVDASEFTETLHHLLTNRTTKVFTAYDGDALCGYLILVPRTDRVLDLNPGEILGGTPVVAPGRYMRLIGSDLLQKALRWAGEEGYLRMEAIVPGIDLDGGDAKMLSDHGFSVVIQYVDMIRALSGITRPQIQQGYTLVPLAEESKEALYQCYHRAFAAGDAVFFFDQEEEERRTFFETLGYEDAILQPASLLLKRDKDLVGFAFVLPFGKENCHISCMCIAPEFRRRGLGELLLGAVMDQAAQQGCGTITLGTDTSMVAFQLYRKHGFEVIGGSMIWSYAFEP